jgi:hypothetical protein
VLCRPSLLYTKENRFGIKDTIFQNLWPVVEYILPVRFHGIEVEQLGLAMVKNAEMHIEKQEENVVEELEYSAFVKLLNK